MYLGIKNVPKVQSGIDKLIINEWIDQGNQFNKELVQSEVVVLIPFPLEEFVGCMKEVSLEDQIQVEKVESSLVASWVAWVASSAAWVDSYVAWVGSYVVWADSYHKLVEGCCWS